MDQTSARNSIFNNIKRINQLQKKIIEQISKLDLKTRNDLILQNYEQILINTAPWFEKFRNTNQDKRSQTEIEEKTINTIQTKTNSIVKENEKKTAKTPETSSFDQLLNEIQKHPDQKLSLLHQILLSIKDLGEKDRRVLELNYLELPNEKLIEELTNLTQIFSLQQ